MAAIATILDERKQRQALDLVHKFLEHFAEIRTAMDQRGLWDEADGMFYDRILTADGESLPVRAQSMVGIIPSLAVGVLDERAAGGEVPINRGFRRFLGRNGFLG